MKTILKKSTVLTILSILLIFFIVPVFAHPGSLDENGGHYDRSTGEYHYHHGYSAHQHENGECPYDFHDNANTEYNPNTNSSSSSSSSYTPTEPTTREQAKQTKQSKLKKLWGFLKNINFDALMTLACLTSFLVFIIYTFISAKLHDLKELKKNRAYIYKYCGEYINGKPIIRKKKAINTRYEEICNEIKQNIKDIKQWNLQNVDLYILLHNLPEDIELDSNFNIVYKEATQERPFGKYTLFCSRDELHFDFNCKGGLPYSSLKIKEAKFSRFPLCKKCISKYKEMDIKDYFDPLCDKRRPIYSKKDLPDYFDPHWYELYQKFISDAKEIKVELTSFRKPLHNDSAAAPSMDKLLEIFSNFPESHEEHIDNEMLQFLDERYSLIKRLKNNDIRTIIKNIPKRIHINSDFSIEISQAQYSPTYGEYTTFLQNNILHRTKHFEGQHTEFASFTYKDEIRVHCKLCEDCWSEISAEKKDKILNPKWYEDLLNLKQDIMRLDIKKREYMPKASSQPTASSLRSGYFEMQKWLKGKGYIEEPTKIVTSGNSSTFFKTIPEIILLTKDNKIVHTDATMEHLYGKYTVFAEEKHSLLHKNKSCCKNKDCFRSYCLPDKYKSYNLCPRCWSNTDKNAFSDLFYPDWYNAIQKLLSDVIIFDSVAAENIDITKKINRIFNSDIYINLHQLADLSLLLIDFKNNVLIDSNKKIYHIDSTKNFTFGKYTLFKELLQRHEIYHTFPHKYSGITEQVPSYKAAANPYFYLCDNCKKKSDKIELNEALSPRWHSIYKKL